MNGMNGMTAIIAIVTTVHDAKEMATVMHSTCRTSLVDGFTACCRKLSCVQIPGALSVSIP